jgi:hypothetical protein
MQHTCAFCSSGIVAIAPFSHRLSFSDLPDEIQRLRCKVNFQALHFVPAITQLGDILIERLKTTESWTDAMKAGGSPKYLALHLRFDKVSSGFLFFPASN